MVEEFREKCDEFVEETLDSTSLLCLNINVFQNSQKRYQQTRKFKKRSTTSKAYKRALIDTLTELGGHK